jgi:protein tyrosine phosphatase (PTP) superfamily phosphohydrolase (DUF442 family)
MDAENLYQVFDWLWTSGQISARDIAALPGLGVRSVINLALPTASNALRGEAELVTGVGLNYFHIPVPWEAPEPYHLARFFALLEVSQGERIWVHCAKNMRVSSFVYLYRRLRLGESDEVASYPLREVWQPDPVWAAFIANALQADR